MDYTAYGLRIRSALALALRSAPPLDEGRSAAERGGAEKRAGADVTVRIGATPAQLPNPIGKHRRWEAAPGAFLMTVDDVARYLVTDGCDVLVEPLGGDERDMGAFLLGSPFAALLQQRGLTTLHASAVETEIGAALFVGHQGAGKSSLASALAERGCALLSDGLTGVEANADGRFLALPASTCTRLRADSLEALGQPPRTLGKVQGESEKHLLPAARLRAEPLAVRAVYVLEPHDRAGIEIQPTPWTQAREALLLHTYRQRFLHDLGRQEEHFRTVDRMAAQVSVFHVRRPTRSFQLQALAERIAAHLRSEAGAHRPPLPPPETPATERSLWKSAPETAAARRRAVTAALQSRGGLFEQAGAALRRRLAARPDDAEALLRLGDLHRGEGRLEAALGACRRVAELRPGHPKASWLCAVLGGADLPEPPPAQAVWPAPFVRVRNFLPPDEHQALLALLLAGREHFSGLAGVDSGYIDESARHSFVANARIIDEVRPGFEPRLRRLVANALPRLGMADLGERHFEVRASVYPAGGFFVAHSDGRKAMGEYEVRRINCLYYLHRQPKPFRGGDLLLHDGEVANTFTRIEPLDNSIVLFPSRCVHEVTLVEGDPDDFGAGRFSVTGYVLTRPVDGC